MTLRDQSVVSLLRDDLEQLGPGVPREDVSTAAATRWPDRVIRRLRSEGFVIEETSDSRFKLYSEPVVSTGGPGASTVAAAAENAAQTGPPVDTTPTLFETTSTEAPGAVPTSAPPAGRGAAGASVDAAHRLFREAA